MDSDYHFPPCNEYVLAVSSTEKSCAALRQNLLSLGIAKVETRTAIAEAKALMKSCSHSCVVINSPFPEESGMDFALWAAENTCAGVIFLVPDICLPQVWDSLAPHGIYVLGKTASGCELAAALSFSILTHIRLSGMEGENTRLKTLVSDMKMIDRSKCVLMEYLGMTENAAHHYIEKLAMDSHRSKIEVARSIIATYES